MFQFVGLFFSFIGFFVNVFCLAALPEAGWAIATGAAIRPAETRTREVNLDNVFMCNILSGNLSDKIIPSNAKWQFA